MKSLLRCFALLCVGLIASGCGGGTTKDTKKKSSKPEAGAKTKPTSKAGNKGDGSGKKTSDPKKSGVKKSTTSKKDGGAKNPGNTKKDPAATAPSGKGKNDSASGLKINPPQVGTKKSDKKK